MYSTKDSIVYLPSATSEKMLELKRELRKYIYLAREEYQAYLIEQSNNLLD